MGRKAADLDVGSVSQDDAGLDQRQWQRVVLLLIDDETGDLLGTERTRSAEELPDPQALAISNDSHPRAAPDEWQAQQNKAIRRLS